MYLLTIYSIRELALVKIVGHKTALFENSLLYSIAKLYNKLPAHIRASGLLPHLNALSAGFLANRAFYSIDDMNVCFIVSFHVIYIFKFYPYCLSVSPHPSDYSYIVIPFATFECG